MHKLILAAAVLASVAGWSLGAQAPPHTQLVIVVDGLRPDYVTPALMPRLSRLGQRGIVFTAHHSVFPTVTRVNASSFVTGAYPETHGLLGNTIYIPRVNETRGLDTGQRENLEAVEKAEGQLLTAPTLGEISTKAGKRLLVVSSGTSGSALLLNHKVGSGAIVHPTFVRPPEIAPRVAAVLGAAPAAATPNTQYIQYVIDAYLKFGLEEFHPDVTLMWLTEPDHTAHAQGVGADLTRESLAMVDAGIGRVEDTLRAKGLLDRTNIIVTSDHGFSTHGGTYRLQALVAPFARKLDDGTSDIVVAEDTIYLRPRPDPTRVAAIVSALQRTPEVGAIFTRAAKKGQSDGVVPGTLSFDVVGWDHARSGAILVSPNWSDEPNAAGFRGKTPQTGAAGHGAASPWDIHNVLMAAGPDFRDHATSDVPTANVDVAPTLLHLMGLPAPSTMAGRVIREGLRDGPAPSSIRVEHLNQTVRTPDGAYELTARISTAADHRYLDSTVVRRQKPGSDVPGLPYKPAEWPAPPMSAAGVPGAWNFIQVASVAITRRGTVLVLHRGAHPLMEFESNGAFVRSSGDGMFSEGKVAAIPKQFWTSDKSHYSAVYGPAGCTSCGAHSVRVDPEGNTWLIDAPGHVVYKLNAEGKEALRLGAKGTPGTDSGHFNLPTDVGFAPNGDIYVTDGYGGARVMKFSREGKFLLQWGRRGKGPGEFGLPHNVVVDSRGRVYVTDRDNERIEVFDPDGKFLTEWAGTGQVSGLAITKDQRIWTGGVLRELDGTVVGRLATAGAHGVAVSDSGDVYLAQLSGVVQKFVK